VKQGKVRFLVRQIGQKLAKRSEDREPRAPAVAVAGAEECSLPQYIRRFLAGGQLTVDSLGDDEAQIMSKPIGKPPMPVLDGMGIAEDWLHPDFAACTNLYRANWHVVCPQIKRAAACQREARMMPVAGKDTILDAAAIKREAHVRAAIIESEHVAVVVNKKDRTMATAHDKPSPRFQFLEGACAHKI
jgi:hypothetical protein